MFAENTQYASLSICTHPRSHIGLDAVYCPDCRDSFSPHTKEYQRAANRDRICNIALVQPTPEHLYQPDSPGCVRPQPLLIPPAPEHLYQPGSEPQSTPYQVGVGDRVKAKDDPYSLYEVEEISGDQANLHCLAYLAGARSGGDRTVPLTQIQFIDSSEQSQGEGDRALSRPPQQSQHPVPLNDSGEVHDASYIEPPLNRSGGRTAQATLSRPPEQSRLNNNPVPLNDSGEVHGWIEKYMVKGRWEHHRYCWQMGGRGGKVFRIHIPRDSGKLKAVRGAIAMGQSPHEIEQLIKYVAG